MQRSSINPTTSFVGGNSKTNAANNNFASRASESPSLKRKLPVSKQPEEEDILKGSPATARSRSRRKMDETEEEAKPTSETRTEEKGEENERSRSVNDFDTREGLLNALNKLSSISSYRSTSGYGDYMSDDTSEASPSNSSDEATVISPSSSCASFQNLQCAAEGSAAAAAEANNDNASNKPIYDKRINPNLDWVITNADPYNTKATTTTIDYELKRLLILRSYNILDSEREESFERLTGMASRIFNVPICLVSLVDLGRQWFMSNRGLGDVRETPRKLAFCSHCIISKDDLLIVPDATKDVRFKDNPLVTSAPNIRFYAGAPLLSPEGYRLGTLCLIDDKTKPNGLSFDEKQTLSELAALVVDNMVSRRNVLLQQKSDQTSKIASMANDLLTPLNGIQLSISMLLEDKSLQCHLNEQQKESLIMADTCSTMMNDICHQTIHAFRNKNTSSNNSSRNSEVQAQLEELNIEAGHKKDNSRDKEEEKKNAIASIDTTEGEGRNAYVKQQHGNQSQLLQQLQSNFNSSINTNINNEEHRGQGKVMINISDMIKKLKLVMQHYPKYVPLHVTADENVPSHIISDEVKIFRSVLNFLTNSCDYTKTGSIHLKIYITPKKSSDEKDNDQIYIHKKAMIVFECEDSGPGIDVAKYKYLFRPFERTSNDDDTAQTETVGDACIRINPKTGELIKTNGLVQCKTTGSDSVTTRMINTSTGLGLYSVANNISSIGGRYGFRPRGQNMDGSRIINNGTGKVTTGSIFWFMVPLKTPAKRQQKQYQDLAFSTSKMTKRAHDDSDEVADILPKSKICKKEEERQTEGASVSSTSSSEDGNIVIPMVDALKRDEDGISDANINLVNQEFAKQIENTTIQAAGHQQTEILKKTAEECLDTNDHCAIDVDAEEKRKRQALIIDDSLIIRKTISRALGKAGFEVTQAVNGMEGLKALQEALFDVVLCDFLMPVMDGLDCVQQYRAWEKKHRPWFQQYIIGISAHASSNDAERGLKVGMNCFKSKPLTLKTLRELESNGQIRVIRNKLDETYRAGYQALSSRITNRQSGLHVHFDKMQVDPTQIGTANTTSKDQKCSGMANSRNSSKESLQSMSPSSSINDKVHRDQNGPVCLIAEDSQTICRAMVSAIKNEGWLTSTVSNGEDALRLLRMRKWDAVFIDEEMPAMTGVRCIERFRHWEKENRVTKQRNVFLISSGIVSRIPPTSSTPPLSSSGSRETMHSNNSSSSPTESVYPNGFDGAIGKPLLLNDIIDSLRVASQRNTIDQDILCR